MISSPKPDFQITGAYCLGTRNSLTEAPSSGLVGTQRPEVLVLSKIRPHDVREEELRERGLPQQEVAQPQLAAGPDDEVGVGAGELAAGGDAGPQLPGDERLVDVLGPQQVALHLRGELSARPQDVPPPAVADRQHQDHLRVAPRGLVGFPRRAQQRRWPPRRVADEVQPDSLPAELVDVVTDEPLVQLHEEVDLLLRMEFREPPRQAPPIRYRKVKWPADGRRS